ncbi:MAG: squalene/phytoene synthase family protein [Ottowia sp.]|nr:squalene/phytoene synthase family protein [Ottowia sp.]
MPASDKQRSRQRPGPGVPDASQAHAGGPDASMRHYALLFAAAERRAAAQALFAFFDEVHGIGDSVSEPHVASAKLAWWQTEIDHGYHGLPTTHPLMARLMPYLRHHGIEQRHLLAMVEGSDIKAGQDAYATFSDLTRYCALSGGALWEALSGFFGPPSWRITRYARTLGQALQLTRIIRDVGHDAHHGRIFLPVDELQQFGVDMEDILDGKHGDGLRRLLQFQAERARTLFDEAIGHLQADGQLQPHKPGLIMTSLYRRLLDHMEKHDFPVLAQRPDLLPLRKFWLAWKMQALGRF